MALPEANKELIRESVTNILRALGENPDREGIKDTPNRVARLYEDILDGNFTAAPKATAFTEVYNQTIAVHNFPFYSFCEHHLLPFHGVAAVGYIPTNKVLGLSKLVRIFRYYCKRVSIQERLTEQVCAHFQEAIKPKGVIVHVQAEHMCMSLRGVKAPGSVTTTTAYRGVFEENVILREQFLADLHHKLM